MAENGLLRTTKASPASRLPQDPREYHIHIVRRGEEIGDDTSLENEIIGYDADRMKARTLLSERLMRRVDWHLMPLCSIMFCSRIWTTRTYVILFVLALKLTLGDRLQMLES